ncbi:MAG: class E sortase [Candidatus Peribacteria bacterium]|jgi:LPXTG-site transpeptidase (sortase) family protein|nr:class E sortase [Candidatus Peribacteria bacterium]
MYQTLTDLEIQSEYEQRNHSSSPFTHFFSEFKIFIIIFLALFLGMYLITNAQLLVDNFQDRFTDPPVVQTFTQAETQTSITMLETYQQKAEKVDELIQKYGEIVSIPQELAPSIDQVLREQLDSYAFNFNLLPPTKRLIIPAINMDVPLIQSSIKTYEDFTAGDFDTELENGVVKYPTTPDPGERGNAFFFGHTSQEYWKYNRYGTVFRNIPKLVPGDRIQIVREGKLYEYKVVTTEIVPPKQVNTTYEKYASLEKEYITLMGCYPIGRSDKRMMVFAERVN